ncbi:putative RNA-directed DNA polymerase [Arabidopsis thaliana]
MNVLSHMIDKAAVNRIIGYHPNCKNIGLTHLCFADDLMVFVEGHARSIEGIIRIFQEFASYSGLKISLEKSTIYFAGISAQIRDQVTTNFPFETGHLPVRYLGLPLLTKRMTASDYAPLIEKVRSKISSWTARALSYAGRLTLIKSVLVSITNFWISAYRLPNSCLKEIEKICAAFLWSGPDLNPNRAKIAWTEICKPINEGGLGIKSLVEANKVSCLKLVWRILSKSESLWVTWIWKYLIRKGSFWLVKESSNMGSWMWKKLLKYRDCAKTMHKVEIKSGSSTSFWFDNWSQLGRLIDITGPRGVIDLGIPLDAMVETALHPRRRRKHRVDILNRIEAEIHTTRQRIRINEKDISMWRFVGDKFKTTFSTKFTWNNIRGTHPTVVWSKGVWFSYSTPKYSFLTWLAIHNKLATGDRIKKWNTGQHVHCVLCTNTEETRDHLFFSCPYSSTIWENLAHRLLQTNYSSNWHQLTAMLHNTRTPRLNLFLLRYVFQATLYHIWRERNARRHGEIPTTTTRQIKLIDGTVRNRLSTITATRNHRYKDGLQLWFSTRSSS